MLIVNPLDADSMETLAILNYFNFPLDVQEDGMQAEWRQALSFKPEDPYPYLEIDSSSPEMPNAHLCQKDNILAFLYNRSIIGTYKTHSAYEKQGLVFANEQL
jgi:hypothetical protein